VEPGSGLTSGTHASTRRGVAALLVRLVVGQAAAIGFYLPLTRVIGVIEAAPDDWTPAQLAGSVVLAAALTALTRLASRRAATTPRRALGAAAALVVGTGFLVTALAVFLHELSVLYGGCSLAGAGLGLALASLAPHGRRSASDRRGLAVLALAAGAVLAGPVASVLVQRFASLASAGAWETLAVLGGVYAAALLASALVV
jgi:hypothetical protein